MKATLSNSSNADGEFHRWNGLFYNRKHRRDEITEAILDRVKEAYGKMGLKKRMIIPHALGALFRFSLWRPVV